MLYVSFEVQGTSEVDSLSCGEHGEALGRDPPVLIQWSRDEDGKRRMRCRYVRDNRFWCRYQQSMYLL